MSTDEITMIAVESSNIESYSWDANKKSTGTMFLKFKNGRTYSYSKVPVDVFNAFISAESKGKYFSSNIRNKFETTQI